MPHTRALSAEQVTHICDQITTNLEGMNIAGNVVHNGVFPHTRHLDRHALEPAFQQFLAKTIQQELSDSGVEAVPPLRKVDGGGDLVLLICPDNSGDTSLQEAYPTDHDIGRARRDFVQALRDRADLGKHEAEEICNNIQSAVCKGVEAVVGRTR